MVTIKETTERKLETADEIAAFLAKRYAAAAESVMFTPGEVVNITSRAGIAPAFGVGDVAVVLFDVPVAPWSHVLALNGDGAEIVIMVPTDSLSKREAAE